ncbi:branched-chain amino acid transport system carrier protein [Betaproteobacteria bacterium]|nr:branched-chain amino acid transport system carrier protein [Betaproteobacteria bacterium]
MKQLVFDALIVGIALFSMFFGAGNIIFPPYVGLASGNEWLLGFVSYYLADVGLALAAIFAMLRSDSIDKVEGVMVRLGHIPARLMMGICVLCIGPLLAVPRTCATTFSISILPLVGDGALWQPLFAVLYFVIVWICSVREVAVVDILGRYLTPVLVLGLMALIVAGCLNPIGPVAAAPTIEEHTVLTGILSGYQTLDMMGAMVFGLIVVNALKAKGHTSDAHKFLSVALATVIAGALLLIIYGGLCYLGASVSTLYPPDIDKGKLITNIATHLLGVSGALILRIVVALACLTTGIALTASTGTFFHTVSRGRCNYAVMVTVVCVFSALVASMGLDAIIAFAGPILLFIYPGAVVVVLLTFFDKIIRSDRIVRFACAGALLGSLCDVLATYIPDVFGSLALLPLQSYGFGWLLPAAVCGLAGAWRKSGGCCE